MPPINPSLEHVSLSQSCLGRFALGATVAVFVITAVGLSSLPPAFIIAFTVVAVAGIVFAAISQRHLLIYEISLLYTMCGQKRWWNEVSEDVILGAIPLEHHSNRIKDEGVTHVITLLEDFELQRGLVSPVTKFQWEEEHITHFHAKAPDFEGVSITHIDMIVRHMERVRRRARRAKEQAKFYIHCKAGRGRSATIVVVDRLLQKHQKRDIDLRNGNLLALIEQEINLVAARRPQISLNPRQRAAILNYIEHQSLITLNYFEHLRLRA